MNAWEALALIYKNDQRVWIGHSPEESWYRVFVNPKAAKRWAKNSRKVIIMEYELNETQRNYIVDVLVNGDNKIVL